MAQELTSPASGTVVLVEVTSAADISRANQAARERSTGLGFTVSESEEIALAVTELASNLVKHAGRGNIRMTAIQADGRTGIQVESEDNGPGIPDVEQAVTDGYSTAGSLGIGLGTINRLMDELEFYTPAERTGLHIVCQRWLRARTEGLPVRWLEFGAATRPCRRAPENGDSIVLRQWHGHALTGVIDGLGHGPSARRASQAARQYIEQHFDQPLTSVFRGVGRACRATRGVVMTLARFDLARQLVVVASVGNVEARLIGNAERRHLGVRRGILGLNAPDPVVTEHPWTPASILIIHSDGLRPQWQWSEFPDLTAKTSNAMALHLLRTLGKIDDDASVVVVRSAIP
jgi:anti-sigma regulatory factor (Ser/Thr protein kinase)